MKLILSLDAFTVRFSSILVSKDEVEQFCSCCSILLLLAAHTYVNDAAAFGEVSIIGVRK